MSSTNSSKETSGAEDHPDVKRVFISYSHEDKKLHEDLLKHLSPLKYSGKITIWYDQEILPGENWSDEVQEHLAEADIILLLLSSDFIDSEYCWKDQVQKALERHQAGEVRVIPILLRDVDWQATPLEKLQVLPRNAQPITLWSNEDNAFRQVVQDIQKVLEFKKEGGETAFWKRLRELPVRALTAFYKNPETDQRPVWPGRLLLISWILLLAVYCVNIALSLFHIVFPAWISSLLVLCLALLCVVPLLREARKGSGTVRERRGLLVRSTMTIALFALGNMLDLFTLGNTLEKKDSLTQLRIGFKYGESDNLAIAQFLDALQLQLKIPVTSYFGPTHLELINALGNGNLEIAWLGPLDYLLARKDFGAKTLLRNTNIQGDTTYRSYIITKAGGPIHTLSDLKGQAIAMGDHFSTGGRLYPLLMLSNAGLHEGEHDFTIDDTLSDVLNAVLNGLSPAGAITSDDYNNALSQGKFHDDEILIVKQSDPIPQGPFAVRSDFADDDALLIRYTFLTIAEDHDLMKKIGIGGFASVNDSTYDPVQKVMDDLGLTLSDIGI